MSINTFNYANGAALGVIPNSEVWTGDFEIANKTLKTVSSVANSRIVWPSLADGVFQQTFTRTNTDSGYVGIVFRGVDSQNYWALIITVSNGRTRLVKYTNGSGDIVYERTLSGITNTVELKVRAIDDTIIAYVNGIRFKTEVDTTYQDATLAGTRLDSAGFYVDNALTPDTPIIRYPEKAMAVTKLGVLYNNHSLLATADATEEFWPHPFETSRITDWPSSRYPLIIYSSTDHATGKGGIFARVWDSDVGPVTDASAWLEWNQISSRAEFNHITQKNEPIYQDPSHDQAETPTVDMLNGVLHMYYHTTTQSNPNNEYPVAVQNTHSATSTNGIDFTLSQRSVVTYNPKYEQGDGHTGYLNITVNPMPNIPFQYLANTTHGGGDLGRSPGQAIWGTDDLVNFERIKVWGRFQGEMSDFHDSASGVDEWIWILWDVGSIKQAGNYWRMIVVIRPDVVSGGADNYSRPVEVLVDDEFNIVAIPNKFIELGASGSYDELEIHHFKEMPYTGPNGERYGVYKGLAQGSVTACGICEITEIDHEWHILQPHSERTVIHSYNQLADFTMDTTASLVDGMIQQTIPASSAAKWTGDTITLADHDMIDIVFKRHGKNGPEDITGSVGLFDNIDNPQTQISLWWPDSSAASTRMLMQVKENGGTLSEEWTRKVIGIIGRGDLNNNEETVRSAHTYGLRIIPKERAVYVLDGVSRTTKHYIFEADLNAPLTLGYKFTNPSVNDDSMRIEGVDVVTYSSSLVQTNTKPTATITGTEIDYAPNSTVPLVCEANDPDGDTLTYLWEQLSNGAPTITIADPNSASTSFLAEAEDANIAVRCTVSDGTDSVIANGTFYITQGSNAAPTANIVASKTTVAAGETFTLDGTSSSDSDGTVSSYLWEQADNGVESVSIATPTSASTNVTAFSSSVQQTVKLRLTVTDEDGAVGSREIDIVVEAVANQSPIANAGADLSVDAGVEFLLDGTNSQDVDGTIVEWRWTQTSGDIVTLNLEEPSKPRAVSPSKIASQVLTFELVTVDDDGAESSPTFVNVNVAAVVQNNVLNIIDKISFTFEFDGLLTAFPGRANRETFRLKPSNPSGLVLEDGYFDFSENDVTRVEISVLDTTGVKIISTDSDSIIVERSKLHARMGDIPVKSSTKEFEPTISVFVGADSRGVVMTAPGLSGGPKVRYYATTARTV
ncbi:hypothetical protein KUL150_10340 [Alteromonas sp. KUL150]|uniref:PKD domain-containing protein n=1 Tax=Alteromonas sp. KUL150 TaxID=2480805 RepID=UPI0012E50CC1|nr:PKD domain-containing protein [Alteromonas sp. KUL150]GFD84975.1 hypothetical protein KUL150_10340 [Alteromonas sp. KUL150]